MADVFISYAREDAAQAERLASALEAAGYSCWWDRNLTPGTRYLAETEAQLKAARAVVVIWSRVSITSHWVADEAAVGRDENRLVALSLDGSMPPLGFRQFQVADLSGWQGDGAAASFRNLLAGLERLVPRGPRLGPFPAAATAPAQAPAVRGNLPRRLAPLIGREAELAQIAALLGEAALVTLTGPGGIGKTRLAIEAAQRVAGEQPDGAFLVELAGVSDAAGIAGAVARALAIDLHEDRREELLDRLRSWRALIVLDNCEHLVEAAAGLAEAVLQAAPDVRILSTSQEILGVEGERVVRLRSLGDEEAHALFLRAARAADPDYCAGVADEAAIKAICERLDGVALAIEMAAARAPVLGAGKLVGLLDDRFRVLTAGRRTALPRQRTLQAMLDWSHSLLNPAEAAVFRRLCVFAGGGTLEAICSVASDENLPPLAVGDVLASLVSKSLVVADRGHQETRYRLLETMRAYAQQKLAEAGETQMVRRRHASYFDAFYEPVLEIWMERRNRQAAHFVIELDNLRAALDWAFGDDGDNGLGCALVGHGFAAAFLGGVLVEWHDLIQTALDRIGPGDRVLRARLIAAQSRVAFLSRRGSPDHFIRGWQEVPAGSDRLARSLVLYAAAGGPSISTAFSREDFDLAVIRAELRSLGWPQDSSLILGLDLFSLLAVRVAEPLDVDALRQITEGLVARARRAGDDGIAYGAIALGSCAEVPWIEAPDRAIDAASEILDADFKDLLRVMPAIILGGLAGRLIFALCERHNDGDRDHACRIAMRLSRHFGGAPLFLFSLPMLAIVDDRLNDGARVLGAVSFGLMPQHREPYLKHVRALLQAGLSPDDYEKCLAEGARLSLGEAVDLAVGAADAGRSA